MWTRAAAVLWRAVPDYLALGKVDGSVDQIHGPGAAIWMALAEPTEEAHLIVELAANYGVEGNDITDDVRRLLHDLEGRGYVRHVP